MVLSFQVRGKEHGPGALPQAGPPPPPAAPPGPPLPAGWQEGIDPASGQKYYFNANTGATQWAMPT